MPQLDIIQPYVCEGIQDGGDLRVTGEEIARLTHTTIVVTAPGFGDDIQAGKAGILEIADVLVVNKSDKPAAESAAQMLTAMLSAGEELHAQSGENMKNNWKVPVIKTSALNGNGVDELAAAVNTHRDFLVSSGEWKTRSVARLKDLLERLIRDSLYDAWNDPPNQNKMQKILRLAADRKRSPFQSARDLFK